MFTSLFHAIVYDPLYNGLIFLVSVVPFHEVGLAVILLTLAVRIVLFPLFSKAIRVQAKMKQIEGALKDIKETYAEDRQQQAQKTMDLYRESGINPFAGIVTVLIQIPIFLALYFIFLRGGLPEVNTELLYSFIQIPEMVNMHFLGFFDLAERSLILALLAGITQYFQIKVSPLGTLKEKPETPNLKDDLARSMQLQMKYGLPILITGVAYFFASAVAVYWITNNIFGIFQEIFVRRRIEAEEEAKQTENNSSL